MLSQLKDLIAGEPTLTISLIRAGIALAVGFGLGLSGEQVALIIVFSEAVLGFINRSKVSPA